MKFTANISRFEDSEIFWTSIIIIPDAIYQDMVKIVPHKRIICRINNSISFHCGMLPKGEFRYIMLSKDKIKSLNLKINDEILVEIFDDNSEYGMNICEEFQEVLFSDPDGNLLFEKLTSGKKRSIIYLISKVKNPELRIEKSFVLVEHLKRNKGKFEPILFQEDCRNFREKKTF
jgi:hypothetical protein